MHHDVSSRARELGPGLLDSEPRSGSLGVDRDRARE